MHNGTISVNRRMFPGPTNMVESILSPRNLDTESIGSKMVSYLLSSSPTPKDVVDLEPRMRSLVLSSSDAGSESKDKDSSNSIVPVKDENTNGLPNGSTMTNGITGLEDDKSFKLVLF